MTPVAMSLGDVLPAIQQGTIDGAVTGIGPIANFHMVDAAKYATQTDQPAIFIIAEVNRKWYDITGGLATTSRQGCRSAIGRNQLVCGPIGQGKRSKLHRQGRRADQTAGY